jgi:uncharacterized OB-fold protein
MTAPTASRCRARPSCRSRTGTAAATAQLRFQRCRDCGAAVFIPQPVCTGCFGSASSG